MTDREKLIKLILGSEILCDTCGDSASSYCAEAIADHLIANGVVFATDTNVGSKWIPVTERLPEENEKEIEGEKHTVSDIVQIAVMDSLGKQFVSDDMLYDGKWVNYPWGDFEITHWKPLPELPKEELPCAK